MLRVGLTGGIGSGKSTVARRLAEHGAVVIDADAIARELVEPGTDVLAEVVAEFGSEVRTEDGELDRKALAAKVFDDDRARKRLNAILHPRIGARTGELMAEAADDAVVVHDVPLLVEGDLASAYHLVIVVDADVTTRVRRLTGSRDMTEKEARARIDVQATEAKRRAVADVWLDNSGTEDEIHRAVDALWADRLVPFEANIRLGRCSYPDRPRLHEPDSGWAGEAAKVITKIRTAVGAHPVDHIGSTAVPGLAAKNVLDLQLLVSTLDEADELADSLVRAGFPRREGEWVDNSKPADAGGEPWPKRLHGAADPARPVNLHIRTLDGPAASYALLVRDWLRAEPAARAEYENLKRKLAAEHDSTADYATAKEPWFDEVYPVVKAWARESGWVFPHRT